MATAYVFPGQGSQFVGMGKDLYEQSAAAREWMDRADAVLGFPLTKVMFEGDADALKQTRHTQPAIYVHSLALIKAHPERFTPAMVAGHSLGEFSALAAAGVFSDEEGLRLVYERATAMQAACDLRPSTMAAVLGLDDEVVEQVCREVGSEVVPANYNSPGQVVISGTVEAVEQAVELLKARGARRAVILNVAGAFHSPLMEPAREQLAQAIEQTPFAAPRCPVYQNVTAEPTTDPEEIRANLIRQLTSPVRWTQTIRNMIRDGADRFVETGPGNVLRGLNRKIDRTVPVEPYLSPS